MLIWGVAILRGALFGVLIIRGSYHLGSILRVPCYRNPYIVVPSVVALFVLVGFRVFLLVLVGFGVLLLPTKPQTFRKPEERKTRRRRDCVLQGLGQVEDAYPEWNNIVFFKSAGTDSEP